jgi:class 3 adenylate cyclase
MVNKRKFRTAETANVKCVFIDIVGFTRGRSVEAQSDLVGYLNRIVKQALRVHRIPISETILLPTGDGIAIALLNRDPFDIHLKLAQTLITLVEEHNSVVDDEMREFEIRIGINENVDNVVLDINGKRNVAGHGVSIAQRVMDKADGGQILVGDSVFEKLKPREKYMDSFRSFRTTAKHGTQLGVHQYTDMYIEGINNEVPRSCVVEKRDKPRTASEFFAHYVGIAVSNRSTLLRQKRQAKRDACAVVLIYFLARDALSTAETAAHEEPFLTTYGAGKATFEEQYQHYLAGDFDVLFALANMIEDSVLNEYTDLFERSLSGASYWLPNDACVDFVRTQHQTIYSAYPLLASFSATLSVIAK